MLRRKRSARAPAPNGHRRRIRKLRLTALLVILLFLGVASFTFGLITAVASQIPTCDPARVPREVDGHIYANDGHTILATLRGSESRILVGTADIAPIMQQAIVAVEDKRFYEHRGVDLRGIGRAVWADITSKSVVQGGSTITQQFVKNSCVTTQRTISRKLKEAALAWQLEQRWKKLRILTAYLNTIYFGNGAYGIQRAAQTYFNTTAARLTLPEAALLAGIPADPSRFDPVTNPTSAKARRLEVLKVMLAQGEISQRDMRRAARTPLPKAADVRLPGIEGPAPYFVNYVKQQLIEQYGTRRVFGGGLDVQSTIDLRLQKYARQAIESILKEPNGPSAALVSIRPSTGEVVAMYGGDNFRQSQFNLAVQGERQAGSSFKPFVLATALKEGVSPATTFPSKPVSIFIGDKYWPVHNYENSYLGSADLTTATVVSDNTVFAQLTRLVGPAKVAATARQLGITRHLNPYFAIGLGADPVSPLEMARAFSSFANGGRRIDGSVFGNHPRAVARVSNPEGKVIDDNKPVNRPVLTRDQDALAHEHPRRRRPLGHRKARGSSRPSRRREDRHDRELRRRLVRGVHTTARNGSVGRLSRSTEADAQRVPRTGGRRRNVPRGDLADVQQACARGDDAAVIPALHIRVRVGEASRVARRSVAARQRPLPRYRARRVFLRARAAAQRGLQAE